MTVRVEVALLASRIRPDEKRIIAALEHRGATVRQVDPRRLTLDPDAPGGWPLVLNREIAATRARYAAEGLEHLGALVINSAAAIATCADKWLTALALYRHNLPTPRTLLALTPDEALSAMADLGYPVVVKPLTSSWGRRVALIRDEDAARAVLEHREAMSSPAEHLIYLQEYVNKPGRDIRVVVAGDRPVAAAYRTSTHWRSNVAMGAVSVRCPVGPDLAKLAVAAAHAVGAELAGVDIVEDTDGSLKVLEVNHGVEIAGIQQAHGDRLDLAAQIADHVVNRAAGGAA